MKNIRLDRSRLIVGLILVVVAVLLPVFVEGGYATAGAIALGILGLTSIAIARRS